MMNLSSHKPTTPGAGETLTITCFTCGMPSSKEWAQRIRSRLSNVQGHALRPYYPFLLQLQSPHGAVLREDGSTFVCAFCHASLEAQWKNYERLPTPIPPMNRKYNLYKFICAVCGVETYRKRVRTLPFQEFPFLANQRAPGSLTLGNNPLAVVCLDCSETLWAQSAEYDRWGLPVHKRHFNWMARPPPPEDSVEATVARLPSGETQLPRCPPIEPVLITKPKEVVVYENNSLSSNLQTSKPRSRSSKSESKMANEPSTNTNVRKTSSASLSSSNPDLDAAGVHNHHSQPPVVTVAPMSGQKKFAKVMPWTGNHTCDQNNESLSAPPNLSSAYPKYDCGLQPPQLGPSIFPRSPIFSPASYSPFHWAGREGSLNDHYSYASLDGLQQSSANASWSWLPPPSSNLVPYQPFMPSSYSNRSYGLNESYYNASHSYYPPSPETNLSSISKNASSSYLPSFALQNSGRSTSPTYVSQVSSSTLSSTDNNNSISVPQRQTSSVSSNEQEVHVRQTSSGGGKSTSSRATAQDSSSSSSSSSAKKSNHVKVSITKNSPSDSGGRGTIPKKSFSSSKVDSNGGGGGKEFCFKSTTNLCGSSDPLPTNFKPKSNAIRKHNKERLMNSGQWKSSHTTKNSNILDEATSLGSKMETMGESDMDIKKWQSKKEKAIATSRHRTTTSSSSEFEPVDFSIVSKERKPELDQNDYNALNNVASTVKNEDGGESGSSPPQTDAVMDLSLSSSLKNSTNSRHAPGSSSTNFMIAYLCKSESTSSHKELSEDSSPHSSEVTECNSELTVDSKTRSDEEPSGRRSVIVTLPKPVSDSCLTTTENASTIQVSSKSFDDDNSVLSPPADDDAELIKMATDESKNTCDDDEENLCDNIESSKESSPLHKVHQATAATTQKSDEIQNVQDDATISSSTDLNNEEEVEMDHMPDVPGKVPEKNEAKNFDNGQSKNAQEFVKKIISEHKQEARNERMRKRKLEADQEEFLSALGLITPKKKSEVELDILIQRCEHHTLPPLKLRPSTPPKVQLTKEFEKKLLQIAFDDPSSLKNDLNQEEISFLAQLDLKPASKQEKTKRENEWRYVLAERMMRGKRGKDLVRGDKKPWDLIIYSPSGSSKLLTPLTKPPSENAEVFGSLSLTLPSEMEETVTGNTGSSDLLTIASTNNQSGSGINKTESITVSAMCIVQRNEQSTKDAYTIISYPKYIPSYAAQVSVPPTNSSSSTEEKTPESSTTAVTTTSDQNSGPTSSPCGIHEEIISNLLIPVDDNDRSQNIQNNETVQTSSSLSNPSVEDSRILKVPVINTATADVSAINNHNNNDAVTNNNVLQCSSASEKIAPGIPSTASSEMKSQFSIFNGIIDADTKNFGHFESEINKLLNGIPPTSPNCKTDSPWPGSLSDWRNLKIKLKKHLKCRQSKLKAIEEKLKRREKQILKQLRPCTKNNQSKF